MLKSPLFAIGLLLITWIVFRILNGFGCELFMARFYCEYFPPYLNAHLLEETSEGAHVPIRDPRFLFSIFSRDL
jgi:hypothetical protein